MEKIYSVGIYARLSVDSHSEKNESIETQMEIARSFLELQPDMVLFDCYSDLGRTGTDFEREGFKRLMADVRFKKVDCIIVKDFSRLGRNYIETGNYIQKIFPFLGVRFIAVTDHFDSLNAEEDDLGMNLKNLANEMYARDIAVKVKSSRKAQWEKGSYTGGLPPYGYRTEWMDGKKCLLPDAVTAGIVKELYQLYDSGKNMKELAEWLYEKKVHRPKDYHKYGHAFQEEGEELLQWARGSVKILLTNPVYMGCLVQARTCGKDYKLRKKHDIASDDWSVKENTHAAIITQEQFFRIARRFEKQAVYSNKRGYFKNVPKEEDIFGRLLFCGECGCRMERTSYVKEFGSGDRVRMYGYFCRNSSRIDGLSCKKKYITCHGLEQLVMKALKQEFALTDMKEEDLAERYNEAAEEKRQEWEKKIKAIQRQIEGGRKRESEQYLKYRDGKMSREIFLYWKEETENKIQKLKEKQEEEKHGMKEWDAAAAEQNHFLAALLEFNGESKLSSGILSALIEKISIFPDKRIRIIFRFREAAFPRIIS